MLSIRRGLNWKRRSRVPRALAGLSEDERRALAPELLRVPRAELDLEQLTSLQLALAGTATLAEIRRVPRAPIDAQRTAEVLLDRRPAWLAGYADWVLEGELDDGTWWLVRALVLAGAIPRPAHPNYLGALLFAGRHRRAPALVEADPALFDHELWALLRADTGTESARAADEAAYTDPGWRGLILGLVADGRMPRDSVLDALLDGLAGDLGGYRAAWHTRVWKELEPTVEEVAARTDRLRVLLGAAAAPVVGFAVKELLRARADVPAAELTGALTASSKTTVRGALKLLGDEPGVAALGHPDAEIQGAVLDRLERAPLDDATGDALLRQLDLLAATVRPRAEALLGLALPQFDEPVEVDASGIPAAIRIPLNFGGPLPPAPIPGEPVLGERVAPIASVEELLPELRRRDDWEVEERVFDAILRFCDQPFPGPARLYPRTDSAWLSPLHRFAYAWLHREVAPWLTFSAEEQRIARGVTGPLLRLPTHAGGWIDPRVLVARMHEHAEEADFAAALLRLAPDHRAAALETARDVPGRRGAVLRCALGGDDVEGEDAAAVAARRVRLPPLKKVITRLRWDGDRCVARGIDVDGPMVQPTAFPLRRDLAAAAAIERLGWNLGTSGYDNTLVPELLELLLPPSEPIAPLTLRLITLALGSILDRDHLIAVDVLIAAIEDGRVDALPTDDVAHVKPNRLAARLTTIAEAGPLPRAVVRDFLDAAVERFPPRSGPLLVLFDELCAQTDTGPLVAREHLATLNHKAAKALLKRKHTPSEADAQLALAARVRRARRWT